MRYIYCPQCGTKLSTKPAGDEGMVPFCEHCNRYWFDNFANCVIVMVYNDKGEIVVCRQSYLSDRYTSFISGYIQPGETAESTALREVKEEVGLDVDHLEYVGSFWFGEKDMLMSGFIAHATSADLHLSAEVDSAEWKHYSVASENFFPERPGNAMWNLYRHYIKTKL